MGNRKRGPLLGLNASDKQPLNIVASQNGGYYLDDCHLIDGGAGGMWVKFQSGRTGYFDNAQNLGQVKWVSPVGKYQQFKLTNGYTARRYDSGRISILPPLSFGLLTLSASVGTFFGR